ncbi:MAG: hypothetical protein OXF41_01985 [bacterium]|nr:hypothetical protein [bacterium]
MTHEAEVAAYARRTIRMRDGKIIEDSGASWAPAVPVPAGASER